MTAIGSTDDHTAEFPIVRRGYDPATVDRFLARLGQRSVERTDALERRIAELEAGLDEARRREEAVHLTFVAATKTKEEMLQEASRQLAEAKAVAKEEAERILSEAQYEAFRIVTGAREEAEAAVDEARREAGTAGASGGDEGASPTKASTAELDRIREEFTAEQAGLADRLEQMRTVTSDLEHRLRALAQGTREELEAMNEAARTGTETHDDLAGAIPSATSVADKDDPSPGRRAAPEPAERPEPLTPLRPPPPEIDDTPATNRGSFYSRRSAGLPRIGADAASAVAAVSAMRGRHHEDTAEDEDHAMQSA